MAVLGKKLFWPLKGSLEYKSSRLWAFAGRISFARPLVSLLIVAVITIPFIVTYNGGLSYNSMDEIGEGYSSVKDSKLLKIVLARVKQCRQRLLLKMMKKWIKPNICPPWKILAVSWKR